MNEDKQKLIVASIACTLSAALFIFALTHKQPEASIEPSATISTKQLANITLRAKAAYVYNPVTGDVLFSKNSEAQLPLASITKVMSAIVAEENIAQNTNIKFADSSWRLEDLVNYTLMISSNDGAEALASAATSIGLANTFKKSKDETFIEAMNSKAVELNLHQTYFLDVAGLDLSDAQSGAYGSAIDVAHLFAYALDTIPSALEATTLADTWFYTQEGDAKPAINTNQALGAIPGLIAGKTGYTDLAGGNLVVAFDAGLNDPIIAVVLGSTKEGRFTDIEKLVRATIDTRSVD